ncbi:MAG: Rpn family recombination-promoting nuclease/putative transposase [Thermoanaerobaculia bacterium]|nr:Rpn family recombination-promoting nuclease/putative transposase [Thermoanaerobaculia bacterium]
MAKKAHRPTHDAGYKRLFSRAGMIEALLCRFIPEPWIAQLDFSTLELIPTHWVSEKHHRRESDLVWRVRFGPEGMDFIVYLLIEHQSTPFRYMVVRLLGYVMLFYDWILQQRLLTPSQRLPPVLPLVLYNGRRRWRAPLGLRELIEPVSGGLERFLPSFRYLVLDEAHLPKEVLGPLDNPATAVFEVERSENLEQIRKVIAAVKEMPLGAEGEAIRRDMAAWLRQVVLPARLPDEELPEVEELEEVDEMLAERVKTWPKKWMAEGYQMAGRKACAKS